MTAATSAPIENASGLWAELVAAEVAKGATLQTARARVANKRPEVHAAYVAEVNGGAEWAKMSMPTVGGLVRR
jgi:hypothetical protein